MQKLLRDKDLLSCCQIIKYRLEQDWLPLLEDEFLHPNYQPSKIHEHIFDLDASIVITPNVDRIYDNFAVAKSQNKARIKKYYEDDVSRSIRGTENYRLILKIHGCIDAPGHLIFTREDYANARSSYDNFYRAIEGLFLTHTVIFLGCGMSDPDISLLLEQYARSFCDSPPHYFVTTTGISGDYANMLKKNYNLKIVQYSPKDNHAELIESLAALVEAVDNRRDQLSETRLW
ncbi:MAG: SIR2 family protein [Alphaproteobacteria bacterium]|nr:SIR2 family protein [Alphaproteobacteria bacterium]